MNRSPIRPVRSFCFDDLKISSWSNKNYRLNLLVYYWRHYFYLEWKQICRCRVSQRCFQCNFIFQNEIRLSRYYANIYTAWMQYGKSHWMAAAEAIVHLKLAQQSKHCIKTTVKRNNNNNNNNVSLACGINDVTYE